MEWMNICQKIGKQDATKFIEDIKYLHAEARCDFNSINHTLNEDDKRALRKQSSFEIQKECFVKL